MIRVFAPAKINLHLRVGAPLSSGFHPLWTWMCSVGLFDELTFTSVVSEPLVKLTCDDPSLPTDERNLIVRAANALAKEARNAGKDVQSVHIALTKRIPSGAGLGGGSSDAGTTLMTLNRLWKLDWPTLRIAQIAQELGSDVPFFLYGSSSWCTGRGEIVRPSAKPKAQWVVLILPTIHMPTPAVYRRFDEMRLRNTSETNREVDLDHWSKLSANDLLTKLVNDLEPPAFAIAPELGRLRERAERAINRTVRMSGSGSSLFTLYDTESEAQSAASELSARLNVKSIVVSLAADEINRPPERF